MGVCASGLPRTSGFVAKFALKEAGGVLLKFAVRNRAGDPGTKMSQEPLVEIRDLNFTYDSRPVLTGINMTIPKGKVVAVMGSSGCGKTTTLRVIGGQLKPTSGSVKVGGQAVHELNGDGLYALRRRMGMLFQFGALFTDMSVYDNIAFQMREHTDLPESVIRDLVMMKLHAVGLRGAHDLMPAELSGGMARRVALARAVALDPMLILYDEPFAGLDPISLSIIGELIRKLNDVLGASSVVVTHDVQESLKIVDYVYFVSAGKIVAEGTAEEIKRSTVPYVHQFVWVKPMARCPFTIPPAPTAMKSWKGPRFVDKVIVSALRSLGQKVTSRIWRLGYASRFFLAMLLHSGTALRRLNLTIREIYFTGVLSLIIILVSGMFVGMVLGLQGYDTLQRYGSTEALGVLVSLSLVRELGPVVAALLFASRAGSAITAEIGMMKATEQLSAMEMMAVDPHCTCGCPALLGGRDINAAVGRPVFGNGDLRRLSGRRPVDWRR
jgi:phospholipid/cholesterol/gamma-HCH transport system ATP-binding protein